MFWVYILKCSDNSYYTGHTDNLEKRVHEHFNQEIPSYYTASRLPLKLVYYEAFYSREQALSSERKIKKWSRNKKEALISKNWELLAALSKRKAKQTTPRDGLCETSSGRTDNDNNSYWALRPKKLLESWSEEARGIWFGGLLAQGCAKLIAGAVSPKNKYPGFWAIKENSLTNHNQYQTQEVFL